MRSVISFFILSCLFNQVALASTGYFSLDQEQNSATELLQDRPEAKRPPRVSAQLNLSPINLPFPLAWGMNIGYRLSDKWAIRADYYTSSVSFGLFVVNVGEIAEKNYTLEFRRFIGNSSFNFNLGLGQRHTVATLEANLFNVVTVSDVLAQSKLKTNYFRLGFGNHWITSKQYVIAFDWLTLNIPFSGSITKSASESAASDSAKSDIETTENVLKYYPSGAIIQLNLGMAF